jgi:hypothetical protein
LPRYATGVSEQRSDLPVLPTSLPWRALLGLVQPASADWARLRGLQYAYLARVVKGRMIAQAIAAIFIMKLFYGIIPLYLLIGWAVMLAAAKAQVYKAENGLADAERRTIGKKEIQQHTRVSLVSALCWALPLLFFMPYGGPAHQLGLWAIFSMLIAAGALWTASAPLACILFTIITGVAAILGFAFGGVYDVAIVVAAFIAIAVLGTVHGARTYLTARVAEAGVAEKSEVVSPSSANPPKKSPISPVTIRSPACPTA